MCVSMVLRTAHVRGLTRFRLQKHFEYCRSRGVIGFKQQSQCNWNCVPGYYSNVSVSPTDLNRKDRTRKNEDDIGVPIALISLPTVNDPFVPACVPLCMGSRSYV